MGDKQRFYAGTSLREIAMQRRAATVAWINSLRRNHR